MGAIELVEGFELVREERGITATRVFIEGDDIDGGDNVPNVGDIFEDTLGSDQGASAYNNTFCRRVVKKAFATDKTKIEYTCHYSNEPCDVAQFNDGATSWTDLPQSNEFAGEYNLIEDPSAGWVYSENDGDLAGEPVTVPIPYKIQTCTKKIQRVVAEADWDTFTSTADSMLGFVNDGNGPPAQDNGGMWLFTSYTSEPFYNFDDEKAYRVELIFTRRNPDTRKDDTKDGWQVVLDKSGVWATPWDPDQKPIYQEADFNQLFE